MSENATPIESVSENAGEKRKRRGRAKLADPLELLPPHSMEAEQGVLGCIMLAPEDCMGKCVEAFKAGGVVFYDLKHQLLYTVLAEMYGEAQAIDTITVQQRLKDKGVLDQVGGISYLASLPETVPSAANLPHYLGIVTEQYALRKVVQTAAELTQRAYAHTGTSEEMLGQAEEMLLAARQQAGETKKEVKGAELVQFAIDRIDHYQRGGAQMIGISTGFAYLDKMMCGMAGGQLIVFAARPGMGKTSLGMNIAEFTAVDQKIPTGVFSLEMTVPELGGRLLFQRAQCDYQRFRTGYFETKDMPKLTKAAPQIANAPLYVDDTSGLTITQLRAKARRMIRDYGCKWFLVDYLQLMRAAHRYQNREQEVAEISGGLKSLAKELNVPVVVLAQFNREIEKEPNRKPRLSDLRESGSIEQDADVVGMLYAPKLKEEEKERLQASAGEDWAKHFHRVNLLIAKQRNGPTGDVELEYWKSCMKFLPHIRTKPKT